MSCRPVFEIGDGNRARELLLGDGVPMDLVRAVHHPEVAGIDPTAGRQAREAVRHIIGLSGLVSHVGRA